MDSTGFILRQSDPSKPFYLCVDNEYPFYFARMIPKLGSFYGHGDGKILKYMQNLINQLADEMELAARYNAQTKVFIDAEKADLRLEEFDSDPSHPIVCNNPHQNVFPMPGQGISNVIPTMIQFLLDQAQRATRFSDIMTGTQQGVSATATQISGQLTQGSVGIKDKASDLQNAMAWCDKYCLKLCLEKWDIPFWVSKFGGQADDVEFIDMQEMNKVSPVVPATGAKIMERLNLKRKNPKAKTVKYDVVKGKPAGMLDFDVTVKLAAGFPKGKNDQFNQLTSLLQLTMIDPTTGQPQPFVDIDIARAKMEEIIGFKLSNDSMSTKPQPVMANGGAINPLGASGEVTMPQGSNVSTQPSNLMGTVPMAKDKRGMQL
jgi:hypothetical protein